jgi:4-hydroxybenzoate polyprenyltransferase
MALLAIMFSLAYSVPVWGIRGKSVPVFSSFLHFGGTLLSFLLGSLTFVSADLRSLLLASYPAVLITAGHLVQEVEDYEEDRLSRCQTNAVRFGQKPVFFLATTLFTFSFVILYWLADIGLLPSVIKYFSILYLGYAVIAAQAYRAGLTQNSVRHLRDQYRILFGIVVLAMLTISLLNKRGL